MLDSFLNCKLCSYESGIVSLHGAIENRIIRLLECDEILNKDERNKLKLLINSKNLNPIGIRNSAIGG